MAMVAGSDLTAKTQATTPPGRWSLITGENNTLFARFRDPAGNFYVAVPPVPNFNRTFLDASDGSDDAKGRLHEAIGYVAGLNAGRDSQNQH